VSTNATPLPFVVNCPNCEAQTALPRSLVKSEFKAKRCWRCQRLFVFSQGKQADTIIVLPLHRG
jgi:uncharacterized paraquat-inducible protein A